MPRLLQPSTPSVLTMKVPRKSVQKMRKCSKKRTWEVSYYQQKNRKPEPEKTPAKPKNSPKITQKNPKKAQSRSSPPSIHRQLQKTKIGAILVAATTPQTAATGVPQPLKHGKCRTNPPNPNRICSRNKPSKPLIGPSNPPNQRSSNPRFAAPSNPLLRPADRLPPRGKP